MATQNNEKLLSKLKNKLKKQQFTMLPDFPAERHFECPERIELMLLMKFVRKRRINMKRKYRAVLENGVLELHNPKQKNSNGFSIEYRVDLAKVVLLHDDSRVVVKLQTEVLLLYPLKMTFVKFRDIIHRHRLWSQEKAIEQAAPLHSITGSPARSPSFQSTSNPSQVSGTSFFVSDSQLLPTEATEAVTNPIQDYLKTVHATSLAVLDVSSRNLEEIYLLVEEMKKLMENLKQDKPATSKISKNTLPTATSIPPQKMDMPLKMNPEATKLKEEELKRPNNEKEDEDEDENEDEDEEDNEI